jgi:hypothetical protein
VSVGFPWWTIYLLILMGGFDCLTHQLFPYHLSENVCRIQRITPFRYYIDMLYDVMRNGMLLAF